MSTPVNNLTLGTIRAALREETCRMIAQQGRRDTWDLPLTDALAPLAPQTLACLIRDLEDTPNHHGALSEQALMNAIKVIWEYGDTQLGKALFGSLVTEYE